MSRTPFEVAELSSPEDFLALEEEWNAMLRSSAYDLPFLRHEWLALWWRHFGAGRRLCVLTARRDGRLVGALPLVEDRQAWGPSSLVKLRSLTNAHSFRFQIPCARGEEGSVRAIWDFLRRRPRRWHLLELERFASGLPADRELLAAARDSRCPTGVWSGGRSPYLTVKGTWQEYFASLRPKHRSNLRNRTKRLEKMGVLEREVITEPTECGAALREAFEIEASGWKGEAESAIAADPALTRFYTEWGEWIAGRGWLRLWFLKVGGKRVAFEYDMEYAGVLYCLKIGYRPELHPFSAGQVLKLGVLERAFHDGLREYDFLGVLDEAKGEWTEESRPFDWVYVYHGSAPARLHHALKFSITPALKRALRRA